MGCWSRWSLPAELQGRSEITEPRCTARYLRLRRPSKGDAHARGGRKTTARPHNEEMSLQPISSFWQFSINKLLDVYSEVWINHCPRCVPDFFFFVSFFLNDNWLIAFSYLIKVHFFRCKKTKMMNSLQMRGVCSCVLDENFSLPLFALCKPAFSPVFMSLYLQHRCNY